MQTKKNPFAFFPDGIREEVILPDSGKNLARQDGDGKSAGIDREGPGRHMSH